MKESQTTDTGEMKEFNKINFEEQNEADRHKCFTGNIFGWEENIEEKNSRTSKNFILFSKKLVDGKNIRVKGTI